MGSLSRGLAGIALASLLSAAGCAGARPLAETAVITADLVAMDNEEVIRLIERPERLAIFPFRNRTPSIAIGAMAEEVFLGEVARFYIWDGASVVPVRDLLLAKGYKWHETANPAESRKIASEIGAEAYLTGSIDEFNPEGTISGIIEVRGIREDRLILIATFVAEARSVLRRELDPRETLRRAFSKILDQASTRLAPRTAEILAQRKTAVEDDLHILQENYRRYLGTIETEDLRRLEELVDAPVAGDLPPIARSFMELRRLAAAQPEIRQLYVQARYRERLAALRAGIEP